MIYTGWNALGWVLAIGMAVALVIGIFNLIYHIGADIAEDLHKRSHEWRVRQLQHERDLKEQNQRSK